MTLGQLIRVFDYDITIQICKPDDWEKFDTLNCDSNIIDALSDEIVRVASAIETDVIRVDLLWE